VRGFILTEVPGSSPGNDDLFFSIVIPALEAGTSIRVWRSILNEVPGSSPGNDDLFFSIVIPGLEPGTPFRIWLRRVV
jgi:hypothetical protein